MNVKNKILFLIISFFTTCISAQSHFPTSWQGSYKGELHIYTTDSVAMKVQMNLEITPTKNDSIFSWKMMYVFNGNKDERPYELQIIDAQKGKYVVNELNSILIDGTYRNGIFTTFFEVEKSFIIAEYTKIENGIEFNLISAQNNPKSSGNTDFKGEKIPEVLSYPVNGRQKAILYKE